MKYFSIVMLVLTLAAAPAQAENKSVVVTIKPLHSLVAGVMQGDDNAPILLVDGKQSLHNYTLKPSQREALEHAALVFYMGDGMETFLDKTLDALPNNVHRVPMEKVPALTLFSVRQGSGFEKEEDSHHQHSETRDLHMWESLANAKAMVSEITTQLARKFPEKKELYFNNARLMGNRIALMDKDMELRMSKLRARPFIVFHDAYQYFEKAYGLNGVGSVTVHPERGMSAGGIKAIQEKIQKAQVVCMFREPQFDSKALDGLTHGTDVKSHVLDPEGALLEPGPELYFQLMEGLAKGMETCLS